MSVECTRFDGVDARRERDRSSARRTRSRRGRCRCRATTSMSSKFVGSAPAGMSRRALGRGGRVVDLVDGRWPRRDARGSAERVARVGRVEIFVAARGEQKESDQETTHVVVTPRRGTIRRSRRGKWWHFDAASSTGRVSIQGAWTRIPYYPVNDFGPLMKGMVIGGVGILHVFLAQFAIGGGMLLSTSSGSRSAARSRTRARSSTATSRSSCSSASSSAR